MWSIFTLALIYPRLCQKVFHLLEGDQDRLPIIGDIPVIDSHELAEIRFQGSVEDGLGKGGTNGPEAAGPVSQMLEQIAFKAATRGKRQGRVEGSIGDA